MTATIQKKMTKEQKKESKALMAAVDTLTKWHLENNYCAPVGIDMLRQIVRVYTADESGLPRWKRVEHIQGTGEFSCTDMTVDISNFQMTGCVDVSLQAVTMALALLHHRDIITSEEPTVYVNEFQYNGEENPDGYFPYNCGTMFELFMDIHFHPEKLLELASQNPKIKLKFAVHLRFILAGIGGERLKVIAYIETCPETSHRIARLQPSVEVKKSPAPHLTGAGLY